MDSLSEATFGLIRQLKRQYTVTSEADYNNILNGRSPEYALQWGHYTNALHWPKGHNYYLGNNLNINDNKKPREILSQKLCNCWN